MKREWTPTVSNTGHLPGQTERQIADLVRGMPGKRIKITIQPYQRRRSSNLNRYYWGVVVESVMQMFREHGNYVDQEDTHNYLKLRVGKLAQVIVTPDGEVVKSLGSTAKLSTQEFQAYLMRIKAWAAEFGLHIPDPGEDITYPSEETEDEEKANHP